MKRLVCCLIALFALQHLTLIAFAPSRCEKQGAIIWVKEKMDRLKMTLALLRRVKDECSAQKSAKVLLDMYGRTGISTVMGEVGEGKMARGESVEVAGSCNASRISSFEQAIAAEMERIEKLELKSTDLTRALEALKRVPMIADADYSASEQEPEEKEK